MTLLQFLVLARAMQIPLTVTQVRRCSRLSTGTHTFNDNNKLKNIETITTHSSGSTVVLTNQLETFTITGGAGKDFITGGNDVDTINTGDNQDTITGGAGDDIITGGTGNDTFNIDSGEDTVNDLTTGDVFVVSANATLNAINVSNFVAPVAVRMTCYRNCKTDC